MDELLQNYKENWFIKILKYIYKVFRYRRLDSSVLMKNKTKNLIGFRFVDSSETWYGIAKQLEKQLIRLGLVPSKNGISICYANDIGEIDPKTLKKINIRNRETLRRAVESRADFLFYSQKSCEKWFKDRKNAYYLPSGADTEIFKIYPEEKRSIDVGFAGKDYGMPIRNEFIKKIKEHKEEFSFENPVDDNEPLYFEKMARFYNRCKIVVNDSQQNEITMRMFEATACGCLLITREVPYLEEIFEFNDEIIVYKTFDEMIEKIKYYLEHEDKRKEIAEKGRQKTVAKHSYYDRAKFVLEKIEKNKNS